MTSLILTFDSFDNTHASFGGSAINGSQQAGRVDILSAGAPALDVGAGVVSNLQLNAGTFTSFGTTIPWITSQTFDLSSLAPGNYELRFGNGQCCFFQEMGVDNVSLIETVPEPASMAILGAGLVGLGLARRKQV